MSPENIETETQQSKTTQEINAIPTSIGQPKERRLSRPEARNPKAKRREEDIIDIEPENIKDINNKKNEEPKNTKNRNNTSPRSAGTPKRGSGGLPPEPPKPPVPPTPEPPEEPEKPKFEKSWLIDDEDILNQITDDDLRRLVEGLHGAIPHNLFDREDWRKQYLDLWNDVYRRGMYQEDKEVVDYILANMSNEIQKMREEQKETRPQQPPVTVTVERGDKFTQEEIDRDREKFYEDLIWVGGTPEDYHPRWYEAFYKTLSTKEQVVVDVELQLAQAVSAKRTAIETKDFGGNRYINGLSKKETIMIYNIEGVEIGLQAYQNLIDDAHKDLASSKQGTRIVDENGVNVTKTFSILECKQTSEVLQFRNMVEDSIAGHLEQTGMDEDKARELAIRAERNAFNLHFIGNSFESNDSNWQGDRREKSPSLSLAELVNPILKGPMKPLDALVDKILKPRGELKEVGTLYPWARTQVLADLMEKGFTPTTLPERFDSVVIVTDPDKYWRVDTSNGITLQAPECYEKQIIGSVWEETRIKGKTLAEYLRDGDTIPWGEPEANNIWGDYATKLSATAVIWDLYTGKMRIQPEKFTQIGGGATHLAEWRTGFERKVADLKQGENWDMLRWFVYVSIGVQPN